MKAATLKQSAKILSLFEDTPLEQVQSLLGSGLLADLRDANIAEINRDEFRRMIGLRPLAPASLQFPVTINYTQSLAEMISAGKYDRVISGITAKNFPVSGNGQAELNAELVHFNRIMADDVLKALDKAGLRPGALAELLAFGAKYPDKQREFPIIALGSVWQGRGGRRSVPVLWGGSGKRSLDLRWFEFGWDEDYRFLAFRKPA